jgi:peptidoglycan hydrolase CwlO-like protein
LGGECTGLGVAASRAFADASSPAQNAKLEATLGDLGAEVRALRSERESREREALALRRALDRLSADKEAADASSRAATRPRNAAASSLASAARRRAAALRSGSATASLFSRRRT